MTAKKSPSTTTTTRPTSYKAPAKAPAKGAPAAPVTPAANTDPNAGLADILSTLSSLQTGGTSPQDAIDTLLGNVNPNAKVFGGVTTKNTSARFGWTNDTGTPFTTSTTESSSSVTDLAQQFFTFTGDKLKTLQNDLFIGGFYGSGTDPSDIAWGSEGDDKTYSAWIQAVTRASKFYAAGRKITVDDVIKMAGEHAGNTGTKTGPTFVSLSDPAELGLQLDQAAKTVLGRKATPDEKRLFAAAIHNQQRAEGAKQSANTKTEGPVDLQSVSPLAQAMTTAHNADPVRADARQVVSQFESMAQMFSQPAPQR